MTWSAGYACALLVTLVCELALAAALVRRGVRRRVVGDALLLNLLTHPVANMVHAAIGGGFVGIELGVIAVELLGYRAVTGLSWRRAALVAVVANAVTAALSWPLSAWLS